MQSRWAWTITVASTTLGMVPAYADEPPTLDVAPSCAAAVDSGSPGARTKQMCFDAERTALAQLLVGWSQYSDAAKSKCVSMATRGSAQSYVGLLTCLETSKEAVGFGEGQRTTGAVSGTGQKPVKPAPRRRQVTVAAPASPPTAPVIAAPTPSAAAPNPSAPTAPEASKSAPARGTIFDAIKEFLWHPPKEQ